MVIGAGSNREKIIENGLLLSKHLPRNANNVVDTHSDIAAQEYPKTQIKKAVER